MILTIIEIVCSLLIPFIIMKNRNGKVVSSVGTTGTAYICGFVFSIIIGILMSTGIVPGRDTSATEIVSYVGISIAIPLLLFSNNMKHLKDLSRKTLISFVLLIISVLVVTTVMFAAYTRKLEDGTILSGMAVALYTGGTPNLNAVANVFMLDREVLVTANVSDIIFGGIFYAFLVFAAKPMTSKIIGNSTECNSIIEGVLFSEDINEVFSVRKKGVLRNFFISFGIVIISLLAGVLIWVIKGKADGTLTNYVVPALMIGATIGGLLLSLNADVRSVKENDIMGQYFAAIFSYCISSMINISTFSSSFFRIFIVYAVITTMTFVVHMILCKIFKIGADMMIVSSTAGIYGPAFIPGVCRAIHADRMMPAGLILGSFGYGIGTFLGILYVRVLAILS